MILVTHLEPTTNPANDSYCRPILNHRGPVEPDNNVEPTGDHYVVGKLPSNRTSRGWTIYLVRWLGYGLEHNAWYDITSLDLAKNLINKYNWDHEARTSTRLKGKLLGPTGPMLTQAAACDVEKPPIAFTCSSVCSAQPHFCSHFATICEVYLNLFSDEPQLGHSLQYPLGGI